MKTSLGIKNFRIFDKEGVILEINPITFLTGCNSSGKSSVTKAIYFLKYILEDKNPFVEFPTNTLHNENCILHGGNDREDTSFSYTRYSKYLHEEVTIHVYLDRHFTITSKDNELIAEGSDVTHRSGWSNFYFKYEYIKNKYLVHLLFAERVWEKHYFQCKDANPEYSDYELCDVVLDTVNDKFTHDSKTPVQFNDVYNSYSYPWFSVSSKGDLREEAIFWLLTNDSFFYIPILDDLEDVTSDEFERFINNKWPSFQIGKTRHYHEYFMKSLAEDFAKSGKSNFLEYYLDKESSQYVGSDFRKESPVDYANQKNIVEYLDGVLYSEDLTDDGYVKEEWRHAEIEELEAVENDFHFDSVSFGLLYHFVAVLNHSVASYDDSCNIIESENYDYRGIRYGSALLASMNNDYSKRIEEELFQQDSLFNLSYVSSSRALIKRLYPYSDNTEFARLILDYINNDSTHKGSFINKWVKIFNIGEEVVFQSVVDNLGAVIYIKKENSRLSNIADEGYGIIQLLSILIQIELVAIKNRNDTIIIEEPEIHLHPRYQSLLTDMFYEAYEEYGIHFIIETHSEYMIRKSQVLVAQMGFETNEEAEKNSPFRTYYISKDSAPYSLGYRKDGKFVKDFGPGFYDEAANLMFEIL